MRNKVLQVFSKRTFENPVYLGRISHLIFLRESLGSTARELYASSYKNLVEKTARHASRVAPESSWVTQQHRVQVVSSLYQEGTVGLGHRIALPNFPQFFAFPYSAVTAVTVTVRYRTYVSQCVM